MNLSTEQKQPHRHTERTGGQGGREVRRMDWKFRPSRCRLIFRMEKQQGPCVKHRELYSRSWDKPQWKIIYTCCLITLLCSRNDHNIVNWLHFNKKNEKQSNKPKCETQLSLGGGNIVGFNFILLLLLQ